VNGWRIRFAGPRLNYGVRHAWLSSQLILSLVPCFIGLYYWESETILNDSDSLRLSGAIAMMQERLGGGGRGVAGNGGSWTVEISMQGVQTSKCRC
jgi:hypothetical protein